MTPEGRVKAHVTARLKQLPKTYRFMPVQNGMGAPALDYFCCVAGRFVAIETKAPGKEPTERQKLTIAQIEAAGGRVFVIHNDAEIEAMMKELSP